MNSLLSNPELYSKISISSNDLIKGNKDLSYEESCMLSDYVMEFIKQSKRLSTKIYLTRTVACFQIMLWNLLNNQRDSKFIAALIC